MHHLEVALKVLEALAKVHLQAAVQNLGDGVLAALVRVHLQVVQIRIHPQAVMAGLEIIIVQVAAVVPQNVPTFHYQYLYQYPLDIQATMVEAQFSLHYLVSFY